MNWMLYLYKRTFINNLKRAMKKPITYFYIAIIVFYVIMIVNSFDDITSRFNFNNATGFFIICGFLTLFFVPGNITSYIRKKGLIFKPADVHMLFPAPVNPKKVLIYAQVKQIVLSSLLTVVVFIMGIMVFKISIAKMLIYIIINFFGENLLESSMMIIFYGNETISNKVLKAFRYILYAFIAFFALFLLYFVINNKISAGILENLLSSNYIRIIPIVGWNISFLRVLFVEIDTIGLVCSILYFISISAFFLWAYKMKCTGQYYEDASKFADDYDTAKRKNKKGEMTFVGHKKKFVKASIEYKGSNAKAIYFRQMLEYKKNRTFIFGITTLVSLGIGIITTILVKNNDFEEFTFFIIPGVCAYITLIFSGYKTKWAKEMDNPYTFLIPDTSIKKLWYATKIEHYRSLADACFIVIIPAVFLKLSILQTLLSIILFICLQADKLYITVLAEALLGNILGSVGKALTQMLLQCIVMTVGALVAVFGSMAFGVEAGFFLMNLAIIVLTIAAFLGATAAFDKMETIQ